MTLSHPGNESDCSFPTHRDAVQAVVTLDAEAWQHYQSGNTLRALEVAQHALDLARRALGESDANVAAILNTLAILHRSTEDYAEARTLYAKALTIWKQTLGEDHPYVATVLGSLAELYEATGNCAAALATAQQALAVWRRVPDSDDRQVAISLHWVAHLHRKMGDYAAAVAPTEEALTILRRVLASDSPGVVAAVNDLANVHMQLDEYEPALALYKEVLRVWRRRRGENDPRMAACLNNMMAIYRKTDATAAALSLCKETLAVSRRTLRDDDPNLAICLSNVVEVYREAGKYAAAVPLCEQALAIRRRTSGDDDAKVAACLETLADLHERQGKWRSALPLRERALSIKQTGLRDEQPAVSRSRSLNNLANVYSELGDYAAARRLLQEALQVMRSGVTEPDASETTCLINLAVVYRKSGDYAAALQACERALSLARRTPVEELNVAASLDALCLVQWEMGDYARALPACEQALAIRRRLQGENHHEVASSLEHLAMLHWACGDDLDAMALCQQSLAIRRRTLGAVHPEVAGSLVGLASLYRGRGQYRLAVSLLQRALRVLQHAYGKQHPAVALVLANLAEMHHTRGEYMSALHLYTRALRMTRRTLGRQHPQVAWIISNVADLYFETGNIPAARRRYQEAPALFQRGVGDNHPYFASCLNSLAALEVVRGRSSVAFKLMSRVAAIDDQMLGQVFSTRSDRQRMAYLGILESRFDIFLSFALQQFDRLPQVARTAYDLVLRRKAVALEALAAERHSVLAGRYPELDDELHVLRNERLLIAKMMLDGPGQQALDRYQEQLATLQSIADRLDADLARQIPEMRLDQQLRSVDRRVVAAHVPEGASLVEFVRFDEYDFNAIPAQRQPVWKPARYVAFVLAAADPEIIHMVDLGQAEPIDRLVSEFRASAVGERAHDSSRLAGPDALASTKADDGAALRAAVLDPLLAALEGCRTLLLAPDGELALLPFEALPTAAGRRLLDDFHISYVGVGRDVLRFGTVPSAEPDEALVAADPDFDLSLKQDRQAQPPRVSPPPGRWSRDVQQARLHFASLPGTRGEGERIAALLGVRPLFKGEVLEAWLKRRRSPKIFHIATHGFFLEDQKGDLQTTSVQLRAAMSVDAFARPSTPLENPSLRSGLALAGANARQTGALLPPEAEDGMLTAEDVSNMDLLDTELAVVSACDTGLGPVRRGEGVFGLRRAFLVAGAKTLVMSLWKVPDQETQELMVNFYKRLLSGESRAEALRGAQLAIKATHPEPFYWGAFICQGDPGPLGQGPARKNALTTAHR